MNLKLDNGTPLIIKDQRDWVCLDMFQKGEFPGGTVQRIPGGYLVTSIIAVGSALEAGPQGLSIQTLFVPLVGNETALPNG